MVTSNLGTGNIFTKADDLLDSAVDGVKDYLGLSEPPNPYMTKAKFYVKRLVETPFQQGWQWMIEVDDGPENFEIYVKDIEYGGGSIDADVTNVGAGSFGKPMSSNAGEVTMTVRDHIDGRVKAWFKKQLAKVKNPDGTVNLPKDYVFNIKVYSVTHDGEKILNDTMRVFAVKRSVSLSYESSAEFVSYPIILQKFSTIGNKAL